MKKIIFYIALIISLFLLINIVKILITDLDRLTEYGFGYLVGKIILFFVFAAVLLVTRKSITKPKET